MSEDLHSSVFWRKVIGQCENCSHCERGYREQNVSGLGKIFFEALTTLPTNYGVSILKEYFHGSKTKRSLREALIREIILEFSII